MALAHALSASVVEALGLALADERDAKATYADILARFGPVRPFVNIVEAEGRHEAALLAIYARYGVPVPPDTAQAPPLADDMDIAGLCAIAVAAEIANVRLYDENLLPAVAGHADIHAVMQRLRDASRDRHLPAFQRCVARGGIPTDEHQSDNGDDGHGLEKDSGPGGPLRGRRGAGRMCNH